MPESGPPRRSACAGMAAKHTSTVSNGRASGLHMVVFLVENRTRKTTAN
jgi:hypothetical protein